MKFNDIIFKLIALFVFSFCFITADAISQTTEDLSGSNSRASKGDTVWVILNYIKPDKCEQFEKFIHEILWPIALESDQQTAKQTRVLHPIAMNEDSTYTYIYLMDPVISNANYDMMYYLRKGYGEEKAMEYGQMLLECLARPQVGYYLIQSQH